MAAIMSMTPFQIVIDTNVLVAAIRSQRGASYRLLMQLGADPRWQMNLSTPLVLEYVEVIMREGKRLGYSEANLNKFLDSICATGCERAVYFSWRPYLRDPDDDFLLDLAVAANADHIITHNKRHFAESGKFGIVILTPREFLQKLGDPI